MEWTNWTNERMNKTNEQTKESMTERLDQPINQSIHPAILPYFFRPRCIYIFFCKVFFWWRFGSSTGWAPTLRLLAFMATWKSAKPQDVKKIERSKDPTRKKCGNIQKKTKGKLKQRVLSKVSLGSILFFCNLQKKQHFCCKIWWFHYSLYQKIVSCDSREHIIPNQKSSPDSSNKSQTSKWRTSFF